MSVIVCLYMLALRQTGNLSRVYQESSREKDPDYVAPEAETPAQCMRKREKSVGTKQRTMGREDVGIVTGISGT